MPRLVEKMIRTQLGLREKELSRRDFFSLFVPFARKMCARCGEEKAVVGPYCVPCSRRQLYSSGPGLSKE